MRPAAAGSWVVLLGCAAGGEPAFDTAESGGRPDRIEAVLRDSPRRYRVVAGGEVVPTPLSELVPIAGLENAGRLDPYVEVLEQSGRPRLRSHPPGPDLRPLYLQATEAFSAGDFEEARRLYAEAAELEPDYFKTYTYLGNALFMLGRYIEAEEAFLLALELNPFDYQAHLFLGDTLLQLGHRHRAKASLTQAFLLNQGNEVVQDRLLFTLAKLALSLRPSRLAPRIRIEAGPDEVRILLDRDDGRRWYPLAACLACWQHEAGCYDRSPVSEDPLRLAMYRECLVHQAAATAGRASAGPEDAGPGSTGDAGRPTTAADERALLAAVESGLLEAVVLFEAIAPRAPAVMLLLPDELRQQVEDYIERYVFFSTQVASLTSEEGLFTLAP